MYNENDVIKLKVKEIINTKTAFDNINGDRVFDKIAEVTKDNSNTVVLDFDGIELVNTAFLTLAIGQGLTMAIANPSNQLLMGISFASDLLSEAGASVSAGAALVSVPDEPEQPAGNCHFADTAGEISGYTGGSDPAGNNRTAACGDGSAF